MNIVRKEALGMVGKYVVKCPICGQTFSSTYSRQDKAIAAMKNHAKWIHGIEVDEWEEAHGESEKKRRFIIELLDGSTVYANKWGTQTGGIWPAMTPTMMIEAKDVVFERKGGITTEHKKIHIPMSSILAIYESK